MAVEPKSNGLVRIYVDLKEKALNQNMLKEIHLKPRLKKFWPTNYFTINLLPKAVFDKFSINHSRMLVVVVIDLVIVIVCMIVQAID